MEKIDFPLKVMAEQELVRRDGEYNTYDMQSVKVRAYEMDCHHLVVWIDELERHERGKYIEMMEQSSDIFGNVSEFSDEDLINMNEDELRAAIMADEI